MLLWSVFYTISISLSQSLRFCDEIFHLAFNWLSISNEMERNDHGRSFISSSLPSFSCPLFFLYDVCASGKNSCRWLKKTVVSLWPGAIGTFWGAAPVKPCSQTWQRYTCPLSTLPPSFLSPLLLFRHLSLHPSIIRSIDPFSSSQTWQRYTGPLSIHLSICVSHTRPSLSWFLVVLLVTWSHPSFDWKR
jgi:hypothetical protein